MADWFGGEEKRLRAIYRDGTREQITRELPRHSWSAIVAKAMKLQLSRPVKLLHEVHPIIARLVAKRKRMAMSQGGAARAIGIDRATLSRFERGRKLPHFRELEKWCDLMQMRIEVSESSASPTSQLQSNEVRR
jgi:DNA-binding XRE family transcriptional regulator